MRDKLQDWLWVAALGIVLLYPSFSRAIEDDRCGAASEYQETATKAAASSERIRPNPMAREQECASLLTDEEIIRNYSVSGWNAEQITAQAAQAPDIDEARRAKIKKLITEAYKYAGGPSAWYDNAWKACTNGK
jgi:hypothetical protein